MTQLPGTCGHRCECTTRGQLSLPASWVKVMVPPEEATYIHASWCGNSSLGGEKAKGASGLQWMNGIFAGKMFCLKDVENLVFRKISGKISSNQGHGISWVCCGSPEVKSSPSSKGWLARRQWSVPVRRFQWPAQPWRMDPLFLITGRNLQHQHWYILFLFFRRWRTKDADSNTPLDTGYCDWIANLQWVDTPSVEAWPNGICHLGLPGPKPESPGHLGRQPPKFTSVKHQQFNPWTMVAESYDAEF